MELAAIVTPVYSSNSEMYMGLRVMPNTPVSTMAFVGLCGATGVLLTLNPKTATSTRIAETQRKGNDIKKRGLNGRERI